MSWLAFLGILIAAVRLLLILSGLFISLRLIKNHFHAQCCLQETSRKYFFSSGIVYLLGLVPRALLLLLLTISSSPDDPESRLDCSSASEGYESTICWTQRLFSATAASVHIVHCVFRVLDTGITRLPPGKLFQHRMTSWHVGAICYAFVVTFQSFSLWPETFRVHWTYEDMRQELQSPRCARFSQTMETWFNFLVDNDKQTVQIHLLLCDEKLYPNSVITYLTCCCIIGLPTLAFISVKLFPQLRSKRVLEKERDNLEIEGLKQCFCCQCNPQLDGAMNLLSTATTIWILILRPILVSLLSMFGERFLDLGTHCLLTLCVLIPITLTTHENTSEKDEDK